MNTINTLLTKNFDQRQLYTALFTATLLLLPATALNLIGPVTLGNGLLALLAILSWKAYDLKNSSLQLFWKCGLILGTTLCLGLIANHLYLQKFYPIVMHDILAYLLAGLTLLTLSNPKIETGKALLWSALFFPIIYVFFLSNPESWYQHFRFEGFAKNPNQFALYLTLSPILILSLWKHYLPKSGLMLGGYTLIATLVLAYFTKTHTLYLAWGAATIYYLSHQLKLTMKNKPQYKKIILTIFISTTLIIGLTLFLFSHSLILLTEKHKHIGELTTRLYLWHQAFQLIQISPIVGFGPGGFLHEWDNLLYSTVYEAHNSFIDLMLQTGVAGLVAYCILLGSIFQKIIHNPKLIAIFIALIVFSFFHFILRHPYFWILLFWLNSEGLKRKETGFQH